MSLGLVKRRAFMLGYKWNTVSGTNNIFLPNSMVSNFRNIKILGNSRHKTYAGTNLLNVKLYDQNITNDGVTFEPQKDGSIIISGKSTNIPTMYLGEYIDLLEDGKSYIFDNCSTAGGTKMVFNDGSPVGYGLKFTVDKSRMISIKPYIQFNTNKPVNGVLHIYPVLNEGNVIKPWEPATGGKPVTEPTPDIPLEIKSAGRKSYNLLNFRDTRGVSNGINYAYKNGIITVEGTSTGIAVLSHTSIPIVAGKYVLSGRSNDTIIYAKITDKNNEVKYYSSTFALTGDEKTCIVYPQIAPGKTVDEVIKPMLNKGTTVTTYEPYSDKYFVDVKVTGRNILNSDDRYDTFTPFYAKAGTKFTLITNSIESAGGNIKFIGEDGSDVWLGIDKGQMKKTDTIRKNVIGFHNVLSKKDGLKYSMVIGDTDEYEPYADKTVQIALDDPLHGIGECRDEIDLKRGKYVQRVYKCKKEDLRIIKWHNNEYFIIGSDIPLPSITKALCNITNTISYSWTNTDSSHYFLQEKGQQVVIALGKKYCNSMEEMQKVLDAGIDFRYILKEPIEHDMTPELQSQLQALCTEKGITNILLKSGDVPAGIEATYKMKSN